MCVEILGISGSSIKNSNTDRLVKRYWMHPVWSLNL